ncbi:hypothetical protein T484DRAFT_3074581 [Baffinella frigidus]|nr:hypothetical protein T484DRAFT_3074581 [Cryptophyta sp. CCMP2293]
MAGRQRERVELDIGDGGKYQGDVEEGVPHGEGRASFPGQRMEFRGLWASGLFFHGQLQEGGEVYCGEFSGGQQHGLGEISETATRTRFLGEFARGAPHGCGAEGGGYGSETFLGQFFRGKRHGLALVSKAGTRSRFELERWEEGHRVCESHQVSREFVGGLPEAATALAEAALRAIASRAEISAAAARAPPPIPLPRKGAGGTAPARSAPQAAAAERSLKVKALAAELAAERNVKVAAEQRCKDLDKENKALREKLADTEKRISGEQLSGGGGSGTNPAVAFLRKELVRARVEADAKVQALEGHVIQIERHCAAQVEARVRASVADLQAKLDAATAELEGLRPRPTPDVANAGVVNTASGSGEEEPLGWTVAPLSGQVRASTRGYDWPFWETLC